MTDDERQRYLFINYWYATELLEKTKEEGTEMALQMQYVLSILKKYDEEMFFRGITSLPMITPENKTTTLSAEKLKELIKKLAE